MPDNGIDKRLRDLERSAVTSSECKAHNELVDKRIRTLEQYRASHDAKIDAWWEAQFKWNAKIERQLTDLTKLMASTKLVIAKWSGAVAAISVFIGWLLKQVEVL